MKKALLKVAIFAQIFSLFLLIDSVAAQSGWELVYDEVDELGSIKGIDFVPGNDGLWETGYAALFDGRVLKTTDAGATWTELSEVMPEYIWGLSFVDENTGYLAGTDGSIFQTVDGGTTWTTVYSNTGDSFNKVAFKDANNGVATGYPNSIYTSDGGTTWNTVAGNDDNFWGLDYAAGNTYYGVEAFTGQVGQTNDNGETWSEVHNTGYDLTICVRFLDEDYGIVGGGSLQVTITEDGGTNWTNHEIGDGFGEILAADWFDKDTLWASGVGIYKSTDGGESWDLDTTMWGDGIANREMRVTGMNVVFVSGDNLGDQVRQIWRKVGPPPIGADFEADVVDVCEGGSVNFTDMSIGPIDSWYWEFEGGTPTTSTDQNPTVTYSTPGVYDVKQVVSIGVLQDSLIKTDYINVVELPAQPDMPSGANTICTNQIETYTTGEVLYAATYEWEVSPEEAGILTWEMTEASLTTADDWSGDFTLKVRAINVCGNGDWSDELEGTIYQGPALFSIEGGGGYCLDGDGVEITLNGSETAVDYELYIDGTETGNIVAGTGSEISFGMITDEGFYTVVATNENCIIQMQEQVQVFTLFPPLEPATPTGPISICLETSSDYESEGSEAADSYEWILLPEEAGTLITNGLEATVEWDSEFSGIVTISLYGINDCGDGNPSEGLEISVGAPNPVITGEEMVCDWSDETYEVPDNEGSTYTWDVSGGTITDGQGTNQVTISWQSEGNGSLSVSEETIDGCEGSSEDFDVVIDDCTGINEMDSDEFIIHPNPADDFVNISSDKMIEQTIIYSMTGKTMKEFHQPGKSIKINITDLEPGLYIVRLITGHQLITKRLIVE